MARLGPINVRINVDASEFERAVDAAVAGLGTSRRTLQALRNTPRLTGVAFAAILWPGKDPEPRKSIAEGRLRAAAKAGYAHVAFEPHAWTRDHGLRTQILPTYELTARGRALLRASA